MSWADTPSWRAATVNALNVYAGIARTEMYALVEKEGTGRGIHHPGLPFRSSAPGDPPARQYGVLAESIAITKSPTVNDLVAEIGPRAEAFRGRDYYAARLEYGTRTIAPRPFVRPTANKVTNLLRGGRVRVTTDGR